MESRHEAQAEHPSPRARAPWYPAPDDVEAVVDEPRRRVRPQRWRAKRPDTVLLATEHHAVASHLTTFLWVLGGALMYQSAAAGDAAGRGFLIGGFGAMAVAVVVGYVAHRRLSAMIIMWYLREGLPLDEARRRTKHDLERARGGAEARRRPSPE